ncbi:glycosyltransferase family 4 protein [Aminomonas paucivorans]|uniref:glycosyltransferase family 4 protein n=1 Tax=Aminomonas paucivorans TaxID=81412 RepID=UPI00332E29AA
MKSSLTVALCTFLWSLVATPVSIGLSRMFRLLDIPGGRKTHEDITPRGAGIVLWMGFLLWSLVVGGRGLTAPYVATGATGVFLVGYMDDMHPLPPLLRLALHLAAAFWVTLPLPVAPAERVLLGLWIAGLTNAFNLIDGMDGLSLSLSLVTILVACAFSGPLTWLPFAGLVAGVLVWNFPHARTFLGDGGSTLLGFLCSSQLAWDLYSVPQRTGLWIFAGILVLVGGVPVLDTCVAMGRRILLGRSPFSPDRGHAHHRLLDRGVSKGTTLALLSAGHLGLVSLGFFLAWP